MQANSVNVPTPTLTKAPPPILEREDPPIIRRPDPKTPEAVIAGQPKPVGPLNRQLAPKPPAKPDVPTLGPERPEPTIDNHDHFWSTYDRVANDYDKETLDAWNKSLDVLLIFAGLFSAINTAFIIEAYKGLQPDPTETTNALLRLFLMHRTDNQTFSLEELNPGSPAPSSDPINSLFFSSLCFSLTAAFGAVTAKQWLTEYSNVGAVKALHVQGRTRQEKYKGLKTWQLQLIIESLPLLLQASLFLFLVGIVRFLWDMDRNVAVLQLALSGFGVTIYVITIIIGILVPTSPFQTPLSKYIPLCFTKLRLLIAALQLQVKTLLDHLRGCISSTNAFSALLEKVKGSSAATHLITFLKPISSMKQQMVNKTQGSTIAKHVRLLKKKVSLLRKGTASTISKAIDADVVKRARTSAMVPVSAVRTWFKSSIFQRKPVATPEETKPWSQAEVTAAEAVVWLLEQAEHPDVILIALDAVPRLPSELLLSIIEKQEDLLGRLIRFHNGLLPVTKATRKNQSWVRSWPNTAIVSGTALWHILKTRNWGLDNLKTDPLMQTIESSDDWKYPASVDSLSITKFLLCHYFGFSTGNGQNTLLTQQHINHITRSATTPGTRPSLLPVKLMDARQALIGGSFSTQVSSVHLALDALIHMASATAQNKQFFNLRTVFSYIINSNAWKAQPDISRNTLSHLALAIAAVHASAITDDVWSYPTASHRDILNKLVRERFAIIDKGKMILENVVLALSMIDTISVPAPGVVDWSPLRYLFRTTVPLFLEAYGSIQNPIPFPTFPHSIIRTAAKHPNDRVLQRQVIQVLGLCPNGDWLSPFNEQYAEPLLKIIGILMSPETGTNINPDDSLMVRLIDKMADFLDDAQLLRALEEEKALYPHIQSILRIFKGAYLSTSPFVRKVLLLRIQSHKPQELLSLQYSIAISALERSVWKPIIPLFFNQLFEDDEELCWPSYFISAEIVSADAQAKDGTQSVAPLRYIDPKGLTTILLRSYTPGSNANLWYGEAVMLLLKKTSRDHANGRLPSTWNDSVFFTYGMVGVIIKFYRQFKQQKHTGTDLESLKDYFSRALDKSRPIEGGKEGGSQPPPGLVNMRAARHKELQNMLRDFDVSDLNEPLVSGGESHIKT